MLGRRTFFASALLALASLALAPALHAQGPPVMRIRDLKDHLQSVETIQGRTGFIVERYEKRGLHAFTLRDDYNDQTVVRTKDTEPYPVMGVTYRVTGWPTRENGDLVLDTLPGQTLPAYPAAALPAQVPNSALLVVWGIATLVGVATLLALGFALRRTLRRSHPEWGELTVASGPDKGRTFSLRRRRIVLGRGVSASRGIRLSTGDTSISNHHALLTYKDGTLFYADMSRNGSRLGGERLEPNQTVRINSGDLIHLGTLGTVVIIRLREIANAPSWWGRLREPNPQADQTLMFSEPTPEEPFWKRQDAPHPTQLPAQVAAGEHEGEDDYEEYSESDTTARPLFSFVGVRPTHHRSVVADESADVIVSPHAKTE